MKRRFVFLLTLAVILALSACDHEGKTAETTRLSQMETEKPSQPAVTDPVATDTAETAPNVTESATAEPVTTEAEHSDLYMPDLNVEDVILYFNEVSLDSEFVNGGDPSYVQKWVQPIYYTLEGGYTDADIAVLDAFSDWLNAMEGFPGIFFTEDITRRNLRICFCDQEEMVSLMGPDFEYMDGGVTFWYIDNEIYDAIICYRDDMEQNLRNSVILEEIYNGLGPVQDTALRADSLIYQEYSQPQWLSPVDELILRLLYHPDILPGMDARECEEVIRRLYY